MTKKKLKPVLAVWATVLDLESKLDELESSEPEQYDALLSHFANATKILFEAGLIDEEWSDLFEKHSPIDYKAHAEGLAWALWCTGCCTPGLSDRLMGCRDPAKAEHGEDCALAGFVASGGRPNRTAHLEE